jgi:hypothetical protein
MISTDVSFLAAHDTSLKEQSLFYSDIPDAELIYYRDVEVGQGFPEELVDAIEGLGTSSEQADMS